MQTKATPTPGAANAGTAVAVEVLINEVDADQAGTDSQEFVELYDGGVGNTDLTGMVLVLFNGSDGASYQAFDLDGMSTGSTGYFVLCGNAATVANCDMDVGIATNLVQNGADAVALLTGDASSFPEDTPVTTDNLLDAMVYDTDDDDNAALLVLLNAGQPQLDERGAGDGTAHSNQRSPSGSGGARNTDTYIQAPPTPGEANHTIGVFTEEDGTLPTTVELDQNYPNPFNPLTSISYSLAISSPVRLSVSDLLGRQVAVLVDEILPAGNHQARFGGADLPSGIYLYRLEAAGIAITKRMVLLK